jgi:hypothetical protein
LKGCFENLEGQTRKSRRKEKRKEKKITDTKSEIDKLNASARDGGTAETI